MAEETPRSPYRRGSVFGALLLIGIGGLFLYSNLHPEFSAWRLLAKYWPVLIIFWGLGKLADYLILRGTPEAVAVTRLSGGDIVGLIFLLFFGTLFSRLVNTVGDHWPPRGLVIGDAELGCLLGSEFEFTDQIRQIVTPPTTLALNNLRGDINLTATPGNEIRLVARKKVCAVNEEEARKLAEGTHLVFEGVAGNYELRWETTAGSQEALNANLEVQVPKGVSLRLASRRGDVQLKGLQGNVEATLDRGDVHIENIRGEVSVKLGKGSASLAGVSGQVRVEGRGSEISFRDIRGGATLEGEFYGPIRFASIGGPANFLSRRTTFSASKIDGELTLDSGRFNLRGVPGDVSLTTRDKDVEMEDITGRLQIENRDGPVVLRFRTPPARDIAVENRSADIELYLPADSGFEIHASTRDGEIESDFSGASLNLLREERGAQILTGTYGARRASIQLSTTYGTIHLRRAGGPPTPPRPPSPPAAPSAPTSF